MADDVIIRLSSKGAGTTRADLDSVAASARKLGLDVQKVGAQATGLDKMTKAANNLSKAGRTMSTFATLPIGAALAFATKSASDLNEQITKTDRVFGPAAASVHKFASTAATEIGQSTRQAEEAVNTFGNLFTALGIGQQPAAEMGEKMTKLAGDLASFNNTDPSDALQALRSGLVGEIEPLRRYGVNLDQATIAQEAMSEGLIKTPGDINPAAKAQAAYAIILKQTTAAQGDFGRTADGVANKTRILRAQMEDAAASIGKNLLPVASKLLDVGSNMASAFAELDPTLQASVIGLAAVAAGIGPVLTLAGNATKAVTGLAKAVQFLAVSENAAALAGASFGLALVGIGAGVAGTAVTLNAFSRANKALIDQQATAVNNAALGAQATKEQVVDAYTTAIEFTGGAAKATENYAAQFGPLQEAARQALGELSDASGVAAPRIVELANSLGINLGKMSQESKEKLSAAIAAISGGVTPTERLADATGILGDQYSTAKEQADAFKEALDATLGVALASEQATLGYSDAQDRLSEALKNSGTEGETKRLADIDRATVGVQQAKERLATAEQKLNDIRSRSLAEDIAAAERDVTRALNDQLHARADLSEAEERVSRLSAGASPKARRDAELALADAKQRVADADAAKAKTDKTFGDVSSGAARQRDIAAAEADVRDAHQGVKDATDGLTTAQDANATSASNLRDRQREVNTALLDVVGSAEADVEALAKAGRISDDAATKKSVLIQRLEELKQKFPELTPQIETYEDLIRQIPGDVRTNVTVLTEDAVAKILQLQQMLKNVGDPNSPAAARITIGIMDAKAGLADGGYVKATPGGVPAVLGEGGGDELVLPLSRPTRTRALMAEARRRGYLLADGGFASATGVDFARSARGGEPRLVVVEKTTVENYAFGDVNGPTMDDVKREARREARVKSLSRGSRGRR